MHNRRDVRTTTPTTNAAFSAAPPTTPTRDAPSYPTREPPSDWDPPVRDETESSLSTEKTPPAQKRVCDACPYCDDRCGDPACPACSGKPRRHPRCFTACEVRRHTTRDSCWICANKNVYDVTKFLPRHPAGTFSIVRHAGGSDCAEDLAFHSPKAQRLWGHHKIGRLVPCPSEHADPGPGPLRRLFSWVVS
mmetsp:Transcript_24833/g.76688  ORF Transcript_24833/g.76688 Transcript_24833/m.76688 type:complete len:192 (-) Transcript_24833:207-782(-)